MRFIHTADWHIGAGRSYIPGSLERTMGVIDDIYDLAIKEGITTVVMAGDVFDSPNSSDDEKRALARKVLAYDAAGIATLMIPGNHDSVSATVSTLDHLETLTRSGRLTHSVVTQSTRLVIRDGYGFLLFVNEPWSAVSRHVHAIRHGSLKQDLKGLIVVAHQTIKGSTTATGMQLPSGITFQPDKDVDYFAFGDLHVAQSLSPGAWYSGSPLQINFGETGPSGVMIVDTQDFQRPRFHEIRSTRLMTVKSGDEVPTDAIVRVVYDERLLLAGELPANVAKVVWQVAEIDLSDIRSTEGLLSGLDEVLARHGLDEEDVHLALQEARKIAIAVGDKGVQHAA